MLIKIKKRECMRYLAGFIIGAVFCLYSCTDENVLGLMDLEKQAATQAFPGTEYSPYWTSTEWTSCGAAVYVDFSDGTVNADEYPGNMHYVRCVANVDPGGVGSDPQEFHSVYFPIAATGQKESIREGDDGYYQSHLTPLNFRKNSDGTVTDTISGLIWTRCSLIEGGIPDSTALCTEVHKKYEWADALDACLNLEYAGRSDWFLPTLPELSSLVDYGRANPAIR